MRVLIPIAPVVVGSVSPVARRGLANGDSFFSREHIVVGALLGLL